MIKGKGARAKDMRPSLWSIVFIRIILIIFALSVTSQSVISGTPLVVLDAGSSNAYSGILVATFIAAMLVARFFSGRLVDAFSRKAGILLGGLFIVIGSGISIFFSSLEVLLVSRALQGVGFAVSHTGTSSAAADVLPRERLGEGISFLGLGQAVSMAVGPSLAIFLVAIGSSQALSWGIGSMGVFILILGCFVDYEKNPQSLPGTAGYRVVWEKRARSAAAAKAAERGAQKEAERSTELAKGEERKRFSLFTNLFERSATSGAIPALFVAFSMPIFISYTTLYAKTLGYENPGVFFFVAAVTAILVRLLSSRIMDTVSPIKIMSVSIFAGILTCLGVYFIHNEVAYWVLGLGYGICLGLIIPVLNSIVIKVAPPHRYGPANAYLFFMYDVGIGVGALLWGFVLDAYGYGAIFVGVTFFMAASLVLAKVLYPKKELEGEPDIISEQ